MSACADCGIELNEGEAACFTVCDGCWNKAYPTVPAAEAERDALRERVAEMLAVAEEHARACALPYPARTLTEMRERALKAEAACAAWREDLIWCSGSHDFAPEGQAHVGWGKVRARLDTDTWESIVVLDALRERALSAEAACAEQQAYIVHLTEARPLHPDSAVDAEVRADREEGRAVDRAAGIDKDWHRSPGAPLLAALRQARAWLTEARHEAQCTFGVGPTPRCACGLSNVIAAIDALGLP